MEELNKISRLLFQKENQAIILTLLFVLVFSTAAMAIVAPAAGSFAYDAYDIGVNKILKGPIGFVLGVLAIGFGAWAAIRTEIIMAISAVLGGAILLKADTVVASLGMII